MNGKAKLESRQMDKQARDAEESLHALQQQVKEKEQENRISKLKIKEMRRMLMLKNNQLQPLQ